MVKTPPDLDKVFNLFRKHYKEIPLMPISITPFQILVCTMLSARTRDEVTTVVCKKLFSIAPTPQTLATLEIDDLEKLLHPLGFYKSKAKYLKQLTYDILTKFKGQVPSSLETLTSLAGVGRKTANIILARAFDIPAISIDTHVHRISNVLGWVNTKTPEQTEKELVKILPKKYWKDVNTLFVSIGQQYRNNKRLEEFLKKYIPI